MTERTVNRPNSPSSLDVSDIYHILFRHKWKIIWVSALGFITALLLPVVKKVQYTSEAKLYVRYVLESSSPTPDANDPRIKLPDNRGDSIVNTELEILTSLDLAQQVANTIGPDKIVGSRGREPYKACVVLRKGLTAEVLKNSSVIRLSFQHPNPEIVQPVLQQLIDLYFKKHTEIHAVGAFDDFLTQETDQLRSDLARTEQELERAKTNLGFYASLEDAKKFQGEQISKIRQSIFDAEAQLAECKAAADQFAGLSHTNPVAMTSTTNKTDHISAEKLAEYKRISGFLDDLYKKEQQQSVVYTPESAWIQALRKQITNYAAVKAQLENQNPELLSFGPADSGRADSTITPRAEFAAQSARVAALNSKIAVLNAQLQRLQREATSVNDAESTITKLQLQKEIEEQRYRHFVQGLEQARIDEKIGNGKVSNISLIQKPSSPIRDNSKLQKARIAVVIVSFGFAIGLAFLLEMVVDRSVKRAGEIEGKMGLPLFLTVPLLHASGNGRSWLGKIPLLGYRNTQGNQKTTISAPDSEAPEGETNANGSELCESAHGPEEPLRPFFDALRDRLISFFEIKNLTHKPKLVAVTSCRNGAGVSTFASGLAASLSETGDGNVLLVDMGQQNGAPKHFIEGRLNCDIDDALESEKRSSALVHDNLYVVSGSGNGTALATQGRLSRVLPKRFTNLVPKLKASDYDYIIFDMPPINQLSVTPRIAKFMDMMLIVIESEKTERDIVKRAVTLVSESKPNLGAVLNKRRTYVPRFLEQEF